MDKLDELIKQKKELEDEITKLREAQTISEVSNFFIRNCRFSFQCNKKWEGLDDQGIDNIKYCSKCGHEVFLCTSEKDVIEALHQNLCVAIPVMLRGKKNTLVGSIIPQKTKSIF